MPQVEAPPEPLTIETAPPVEVGKTVALLRLALAELLKSKRITEQAAVEAIRFLDSH